MHTSEFEPDNHTTLKRVSYYLLLLWNCQTDNVNYLNNDQTTVTNRTIAFHEAVTNINRNIW